MALTPSAPPGGARAASASSCRLTLAACAEKISASRSLRYGVAGKGFSSENKRPGIPAAGLVQVRFRDPAGLRFNLRAAPPLGLLFIGCAYGGIGRHATLRW